MSGKCLLVIVVGSLIVGCASRIAGVGAGAGIIHPTKQDVKVISDSLTTQLVQHNRWCEKAPECRKN